MNLQALVRNSTDAMRESRVLDIVHLVRNYSNYCTKISIALCIVHISSYFSVKKMMRIALLT